MLRMDIFLFICQIILFEWQGGVLTASQFYLSYLSFMNHEFCWLVFSLLHWWQFDKYLVLNTSATLLPFLVPTKTYNERNQIIIHKWVYIRVLLVAKNKNYLHRKINTGEHKIICTVWVLATLILCEALAVHRTPSFANYFFLRLQTGTDCIQSQKSHQNHHFWKNVGSLLTPKLYFVNKQQSSVDILHKNNFGLSFYTCFISLAFWHKKW